MSILSLRNRLSSAAHIIPSMRAKRYKIDMIKELANAKFGIGEVSLSSQKIVEILNTIYVVDKIDIYGRLLYYYMYDCDIK